MQAILTLARKDTKLLFRDKFALFWIFAFPLMYALFFGSIFGDDGDGSRGRLSIAVVDEDQTERSAALVARLAEHESVRVQRHEEGEGDGATYVLRDLEVARRLVRTGKRAAYLRINAGYGASPFAVFANDGEDPLLELGIDPSRSAETGFLQGIVTQVVFGGLSDAFTDRQALRGEVERATREIREADDLNVIQKGVLGTFMAALDSFLAEVDTDVLAAGPGGGGGIGGFSPGQFVDVVDVSRERGNQPRSAFEITFPSAIVWGLMGVAVAFAVTLVRERAQGTFIRLRIAPITRAQILAGKALGCGLTCVVVMAFLMLFSAVALGVRISNLPLAVVSMLCTAVCFTGLMMTISVMGKTEEAVAGASWGVMMPFAMIGGGMIPLIAMPSWLQTLSHVSPFKWAILSIEGAVWRGLTVSELLLPWGILLATGAAFFGLGVLIFRRLDP